MAVICSYKALKKSRSEWGTERREGRKEKMHTSLYSTRHECLLCNDVITNPICYSCIESEVEEWLSDRMPKLVPKLKKTGEMFASYTHKGTRCILCGNNMNICTHCYCYEANKLFESYPRLAEEFVEFFNFELRGSTQCSARPEEF